MSDRILVIDAGSILSPADKFLPGRVVIRNGTVETVGLLSDVRVPDGADRIDTPRLTLVPGFIDPHIHGSGGVDVMDATFASMNKISGRLASHGTTSFLPTTVSAPPKILEDVLDRMTPLLGQAFDGARPLGIHLEGPFISAQKRGTHRSENVRPPDSLLMLDWIARSRGALKLITLAPELKGATEITRLAGDFGLTVAMGHSDATYEEASSAADSGTH